MFFIWYLPSNYSINFRQTLCYQSLLSIYFSWRFHQVSREGVWPREWSGRHGGRGCRECFQTFLGPKQLQGLNDWRWRHCFRWCWIFEHKSKQGKSRQFLRHTIEGYLLLWIVRQQGLFGQSVLFEAHLYSHPYSNQWWNLRCGVCDCGLTEYKTSDKMGSKCRDRNFECWGYAWIWNS